jgi:phosphinothricin acetyltransferase
MPDDLERIAGTFGHYVRSSVTTFEEVPPPVETWRQRLDDLDAVGLPFLAASVRGETVGYAYATTWRPKPAYRHTVEDSVYLASAWTGQGLGRLLLVELLAHCASADVRQVIAVIADTGDPASAALHRALGFAEAGLLRAVGDKQGRCDTLLLQREIAPGAISSRVGTGPLARHAE